MNRKKKEQELVLKPWINDFILDKCKKLDAILKRMSKNKNKVDSVNLHAEYKKLASEHQII